MQCKGLKGNKPKNLKRISQAKAISTSDLLEYSLQVLRLLPPLKLVAMI
jgi:hypothetical protein